MDKYILATHLSDALGVPLAVVQKWVDLNKYPSFLTEKGEIAFRMEDLKEIEVINEMLNSKWEEEEKIKSKRPFTSIELFAGGGGLALGMEKAGFKHVLLNEFDSTAVKTLRGNRPRWNVLEGDVRNIDFLPWRGKVDFLSGGFPCQAFSYAGKKGGFEDTRGTLFFELARAVLEIRPKVFLGENVKGLISHEEGRTLATIKETIKDLGYMLIEPRVLRAVTYKVPQKRERLFLVAIRKDYADKVKFHWPSPYHRVLTLRDAFYSGELYENDVPYSLGATYPISKQRVLEMVPMGGDWRNLPEEVQKSYMGGSFYLGGGKTGMARRLSLDEPSLTLTCAPAQKQTERCHPIETRPLTVREYARIQTFPDDWQFAGNIAAQYKQIGNAVPVNLACAMGRSIIRLLNDIEEIDSLNQKNQSIIDEKSINTIMESYVQQMTLFEPESKIKVTRKKTKI